MKSEAKMTRNRACLHRIVRRCFNCRHAGKGFKAFGVTSHHCKHPDKDVRDIPPQDCGWGTLREWHNTCDHWEKRLTHEASDTSSNLERESTREPEGRLRVGSSFQPNMK